MYLNPSVWCDTPRQAKTRPHVRLRCKQVTPEKDKALMSRRIVRRETSNSSANALPVILPRVCSNRMTDNNRSARMAVFLIIG